MKRLLIPFMMILFVSAISCQLSAQKDKKHKTITLKIEKETDEGNLVIDTTFTLKEGEDLHEIMEKYGIKAEVYPKHGHSFDVEIELDDSLDIDKKDKMVWVTADVNDDGKKYKVKSKQKHVVIVSDDDDVEIIKIKKGKKEHESEYDENVMIEKIKGDSLKITKKIIIRDSKAPKHKKIKRIYEFKSDSTTDGHEMFFFSDDDLHEVIIKKLDIDKDSIEVIVKKMEQGKHGKHIYITTDDDINWTSDEDVHFESKEKNLHNVQIKIMAVDDAGLKILNQKKGFKTFNDKDFTVNYNDNKDLLSIEFNSSGKGTLTVKIVDNNGKEILSDKIKQYDGNYKKEIQLKKGTYYVQFTLDKEHYIRKIILDKE